MTSMTSAKLKSRPAWKEISCSQSFSRGDIRKQTVVSTRRRAVTNNRRSPVISAKLIEREIGNCQLRNYAEIENAQRRSQALSPDGEWKNKAWALARASHPDEENQ